MVTIPVRHFKVEELPPQLAPNAFYMVKGPADVRFRTFLTDILGNPIASIGNQVEELEPVTHDQAELAAQWIVNHNRGRQPASVLVLSPGGVEILADVVHTSPNQLVVNFAAPTAGRVIVF